MMLLTVLADLDMPPDWMILRASLDWPEDAPYMSAAQIQNFAAHRSIEVPGDENIVALAALMSDQREETAEILEELSVSSPITLLEAKELLLALRLRTECSEVIDGTAVFKISRLLGYFSDHEWPSGQPESIGRWRQNSGYIDHRWSEDGYEQLRSEVRQWADSRVREIRQKLS